MINIEKARRYCNEDITLIENYDKAIADGAVMWHCHHRKESTVTKQQLIEQGDYWQVPARDLIFILPSEHLDLHFWHCAGADERRAKISRKSKGNNHCAGWSNFKGHHHTEEAKRKIGEASA
jgi:hypothetical protein